MDDQFEGGTRYRAAFLAALETAAGRILNGVAGPPNVAIMFEESLVHAGADIGFQLCIPAANAVEFFMLTESPHRANEIVSGATDIADEIVRVVA